jgi:hypothetical protein
MQHEPLDAILLGKMDIRAAGPRCKMLLGVLNGDNSLE